MLVVLLLAAVGVGGFVFGFVSNITKGEGSSTARFEGYLEQIARDQRELRAYKPQPPPKEESAIEASPSEPVKHSESYELKSRLQSALQSLDRPESRDRSSDSVPEPSRTTDQSTTPRDGTNR